jgi:hypothetical protein
VFDGLVIIMNKSHHWFRLGVVPATLAGVAAILAWWYLDRWDSRKQQIYAAMSRECHPVWRDLDAGRVRAGQAVEDVIERTRPVQVEHFENVTFLHYHPPGFTGLTIVAKNGRLVSAGAASCTWDWTFFDTWPAVERDAFYKRYHEHLERTWNARQAVTAVLDMIGVASWFLRGI